MKRGRVARHHARRPRRPAAPVPLDERISKRDALLPTALPHVERLVLAARRRWFKPVTEFHPMEGDILVAVVCRYCRAPFEPYARSRQQQHAAEHVRARRAVNVVLLVRPPGPWPSTTSRERRRLDEPRRVGPLGILPRRREASNKEHREHRPRGR